MPIGYVDVGGGSASTTRHALASACSVNYGLTSTPATIVQPLWKPAANTISPRRM
jgi:hypothetical protein